MRCREPAVAPCATARGSRSRSPAGRRRQLVLGLRVGVAADHQRHREPERAVLVADLDPRQVERVEDELDLRPTNAASTSYWLACSDTVAVLVTVRSSDHRRTPRAAAPASAARAPPRHEPLQRRLPGLGVRAAVIDRLDPRANSRLSSAEIEPPRLDLDQELIADRAEEPLDLALRRAGRGPAWTSFTPEHGARPQQLRGDNAVPLSTRTRRGRRVLPARRAARPPARHVLAGPHRYPTSSRLWSSMNANRIARRRRAAMIGPCSASPVHSSFRAWPRSGPRPSPTTAGRVPRRQPQAREMGRHRPRPGAPPRRRA